MMTLQDLCIGVIVDDFDRYYLAFSKSDDANLKRKFEFLQRVYSFQIASQLYALDKMQTSYIDLLVNKYLKILDTDWFKDCPWKTIFAKFAEIGSNLQKIYFHECSEDMPWQNIIHHLSNLEVMSFPVDCNDEILKCIAQSCPNIVEIDVSNSCQVTNDGIRYLCMKENGKPLCPRLKKLFISSSDVKEDGVKYLMKNLQSLEVTDYHELPQVLYSLHENELSTLDKIQPYNLTSLDLLHMYCVPYYTNLLKVCLSLCPYLKSLSCPISSKEHLDLFSSPFELEKLHLECYTHSKIDVTNLLKLKGRKLTSLTVSLCSLSVPALAESCPCLKQLHLNQVNFQNDGNITPVFRHLETCVFDYTAYEPGTAKSMSSLLKCSPKLEHIGFKRCDLSSSELKTEILRCCEYCPIKKVNFCGSTVDINFVKDILLNCHTLQWFQLDNCDLDGEEELELYRFAQVLPNNPEVNFNEHLSLSDIEDDFLNSFYDFDDDYDDYDDYDDFYHYDDDDDDDDVDEDYGCYFEL